MVETGDVEQPYQNGRSRELKKLYGRKLGDGGGRRRVGTVRERKG